MATIRVNGTSRYCEDTGSAAPPIVFSHGLLWNTEPFAPQIAVLNDRHPCVAYDHRGQGKSADGTGRAIDRDIVADDAAALIEALPYFIHSDEECQTPRVASAAREHPREFTTLADFGQRSRA
jgi:pimeloyl-ACP methyl ester carboxylesterase